MFQWLGNILNLGNNASFDDNAPDTTSSAAKSNQDRQSDRAMQDRLDAFMEGQKKADEDGEWTEENQSKAEEGFQDSEEVRSKQETPASLHDVDKAIDDAINKLVSQQRLLPFGAEDEDAVMYIDGRPAWAVMGELFLKVPPGAVSELYLALKKHDCPSLVIADAVVIKRDGAGDPEWYAQFDYLRGVATPTP